MTCIAFDGKYLAADKLCVSGGGIGRTVTKIWKHNDVLLGVTGEFDMGLELVEWYTAGGDPDKFPAEARKDNKATLIVIGRRGIRTYGSGPYPMTYEQQKCAWGSGRDFAEAAMYLGETAEGAVLVACKFQTDCGRGVDVLERGWS